MSTGNINIGESELEIMKVIWRAGMPINSTTISEAVKEKGWKRTTIATFLVRLTEKGAISAKKIGKSLYYTPILTSAEYKKTQVKNLFDGSAGNLVTALFEEEEFSDKDIRELKAIFEDKEG